MAKQRFNFCCLLVYVFILASAAAVQSSSSDVSVLLKIKSYLGEKSQALSSWNISNPVCQWQGVAWILTNGVALNCSLQETSKNLSLVIDPAIAVQVLSLPSQHLTGSVPKDIGKLTNLQKLNFSGNILTGSIPEELGNASALSSVDLSHNMLSGAIPASIWNLCGSLTDLVLDHNELTGRIPSPSNSSLQCSSLRTLRLNSNNLTGEIPQFLRSLDITDLELGGNSLFQSAELAVSPAPAPSSVSGGSTKKDGLAAGLVAGLIIGALVAGVLFMSLCIGFCTTKKAKLSTSPSLRQDIEEAVAGSGKLVLFEGGEHLTSDDVLNASGEVLGKTGLGTVYKARLNNGSLIALRLLREGAAKEPEDFVKAVQQLGVVRHKNLVPLRAYYHGAKDERLLVYDYLSRGNLSDILHKTVPRSAAPGWARKHKIALGAARGLAHLHTALSTPIVHGNLKSKNILVDENYEAHLSDYGLHLLMTRSACIEVLDASTEEGYKAPELSKMRKANAKTDIYSFGIVLLELLTGRKPGKTETANEVVDLPLVVKTAVLEEKTSEIFDLELLKTVRSAEDGLLQALKLAMGCCAPHPHVRPHIKEVVRQLEEIRPRTHTPGFTPSETRSHTPVFTPTDSRSRDLPF